VTGDAHPFKLEIVPVGFDDEGEKITSCVVCSDESINKGFNRLLPPKSGNQKIIWDALQDIFKKVDSKQVGAPIEAPCIRLGDAIDKTRGRLVCEPKRQSERTQSAISGLVAKGLLKFQDDWLWMA
jgi:putative DNA primase/helicase